MNSPTHDPEISAILKKPANPISRILFALACLVTLIALFYAVENWRGSRALNAYKAELAARGEPADWKSFVPFPVPDDQNMLKTPLLEAWFNKDTTNQAALRRLVEMNNLSDPKHNRPALIKVKLAIGPSAAESDQNESRYTFATFTNNNTFQTLAQQAGVSILTDPVGNLIQFSPSNFSPLQFELRLADNSEKTKLDEILRKNNFQWQQTSVPGVLDLVSSADPAENVLEHFKKFEAEFEDLYSAFQRPYARFAFEQPFSDKYPNYVRLRTVAQMLGARADAELLTGRPDMALRDVLAIFSEAEMLRGAEPTLVAAMIRVSLAGLAESVIENGFEIGVWQDPQLVAIQDQLNKMDLPSFVSTSLKYERVAAGFILENYSRQKLAEILTPKGKSPWMTPMGLYIQLCPRGWLQQNNVAAARAYETSSPLPRTPYTFLAEMTVPNFSKARLVAEKNQSLLNQTRIACALERYRLVNLDYPEKLPQLVPKFITAVPKDHDGADLKYQRKGKNEFLLYSLGPNGKDDGGINKGDLDWLWRGESRFQSRPLPMTAKN